MATIIGHRGLWTDGAAPNSLDAFERSFAAGFGVEADVRDHAGGLVISHDPPRGDEISLDALLAAYVKHGRPGRLALNIKADGLHELLEAAIDAHRVGDWFAFDMSVPDSVAYSRAGVRFFTRVSEHEPGPALYEQSAGVWVDLFEREWFDDVLLRSHLDAGKQVCVVSPELHGRDPQGAWAQWKEWPSFESADVAVCTDHPETLSELLPS